MATKFFGAPVPNIPGTNLPVTYTNAFTGSHQVVNDLFNMGRPEGYNSSDDLDMAQYAAKNAPMYRAAYDPNDPNYKAGYDLIKGEALSKGPSGWLNLFRQRSALEDKDARDRAAQTGKAQTAEAADKLAASGGLSSGARERVAEQGQKNYMNMSQDITRQGQMNDLGASIQDQTNHLGMINNLANLDTTRANQWSQEVARRNQHDLDLYHEKMAALAANEQAKATERSGKQSK